MANLSTNTIAGLASALGSKSGAVEIDDLLGGVGVTLRNADPTGVGYSDGAFKEAITQALDTSQTYGDGLVYIPPGTYRISESGLLSGNFISGLALQGGLRFVGAGKRSTKIILDVTDGVEKFFYDDTGTNGILQCTYEHINFSSDATSSDSSTRLLCGGWRFEGDSKGGVRAFNWTNCRFDGINEIVRVNGGSSGVNNDTMNFMFCQALYCNTLYAFDNVNAVLNSSFGCLWEGFRKDMVIIEDGGGGDLYMYGCSLIMENDTGDTTVHYVLNAENTTYAGKNIVFHGCRTELRNEYACLAKLTGDHASVQPVQFTECNFAVAQGNARTLVDIGGNVALQFTRCYFPSTVNKFLYDLESLTGQSYSLGPFIHFDGCFIPYTLPEDITYAGTSYTTAATKYGRVLATNCLSSFASSGVRRAIDFDYNFHNTYFTEGGGCVKVANLKAALQVWPTNGGSTRSVVLPPGAIVTGVLIDKPAGGASATATTYRIADGDATVYAETGSAAANLAHKVFAGLANDTAYPRIVGTTTNSRTLTLTETTLATNTLTGGRAMVFYI
jgi:hypothetical protein